MPDLGTPLSVAGLLAGAWILGNLAELCKAPALVGQLIAGIALGPYALKLISEGSDVRSGMVVAGELGLIMLVFEGGLSMESTVLKEIGARAFVLAFFGTLFPVVTGWLLMWAMGFGLIESLACGTALSSTAIGFTLQLMQDFNMMSTKIGQLIAAAAIIDDIMSLVVMAVLSNISSEGTPVWHIFRPFVASFGALVVGIVFKTLTGWIASHSPQGAVHSKVYEPFLGLIMLGSCLGLTVAANAVHTSHLLGAFMAGFAFTEIARAKELWDKHTPPVLSWLMLLFFACTVGFRVRLDAMFKSTAVLYGLVLTLVAMYGKFMSGIFAAPLRSPGYKYKACIVGAAMIGRGELGFMIASEALDSKLLTEESFSATVWALLLATLLGPLLFRLMLLRWKPYVLQPDQPDPTSPSLQAMGHGPLYVAPIDSTPLSDPTKTPGFPGNSYQPTTMAKIERVPTKKPRDFDSMDANRVSDGEMREQLHLQDFKVNIINSNSQ